MGKDMEIEQVFIRGLHSALFHYDEPAEVIGLRFCRPPDVTGKYPPRLCYMLLWPDGKVDYWPVQDAASYKFMDTMEKEKYLQDQREVKLRETDPLADELATKQLLVTWQFCDLVNNATTENDAIRSQMFVMCKTGQMRYATKINTDGKTFFDDGRISGLAPSTACLCELYRPATPDEIATWLLKRLYSVKKKNNG